MNSTATNEQWTNVKNFYLKHKIFINCTILTFLFLIHCFWQEMTYIVFPILAIMVLVDNLEDGFSYLLFGISFYLLNVFVSMFIYVGIVVSYLIKLCIVIFVKEKQKLNKTTLFLILAYLIYVILPFGPYNKNWILKLCLTTFVLLGLMIIVMRPKTFRLDYNIKILCYSLIVSSVLGSTYFVSPYLQSFNKVTILSSNFVRFEALFTSPNTLAMFCEVALSSLVYFIITKEKKLSYSILFIIVSILGLLTFSKTYFIIVFLIYIFLFVWLIKTYKAKALIGTGIVLAVGLIAVAIFPKVFMTFINRFVGSIGKCDSFADIMNMITTGRYDLWTDYINHIFTHPKTLFFGDGLGALIASRMSAHNVYISMLHQLGLVGSILFIASIVYMLNQLKHKEVKISRAIILTFVVLGLLFFVEDTIFYMVF